MNRSLPAVAVVVAGLLVASCASTTFNQTWRAPDAPPVDFAGQKVAALVVHPEEAVRRGAEQYLARELTQRGAIGVPAYGIVSQELAADQGAREKAREAFAEAGVVGVVAMRLVGQDQDVSSGGYWGSPNYTAFWGGYWGWGWGMVLSPGYLQSETVFHVESLVYDLRSGGLVWAGVSKTTDPSDAGAFIHELADAVAAELRQEKLIR